MKKNKDLPTMIGRKANGSEEWRQRLKEIKAQKGL
jgi:hypothetical protein